jgi:hypothetical protein
MRHGTLTYHTGNYDEYEKNLEETRLHQVSLQHITEMRILCTASNGVQYPIAHVK